MTILYFLFSQIARTFLSLSLSYPPSHLPPPVSVPMWLHCFSSYCYGSTIWKSSSSIELWSFSPTQRYSYNPPISLCCHIFPLLNNSHHHRSMLRTASILKTNFLDPHFFPVTALFLCFLFTKPPKRVVSVCNTYLSSPSCYLGFLLNHFTLPNPMVNFQSSYLTKFITSYTLKNLIFLLGNH